MAAQFKKHPFLLSVEDVARHLDSDLERGLSSSQVSQLQQRYPPNELDVGGAIPWYKIFIKQLLNAMILVRHRLNNISY
jgi:P-type Na+/K+ transporter